MLESFKSASFEALLCSLVHRVYCEVNQYSKIEIWGGWVGQNNFENKSKYFNTDYYEQPLMYSAEYTVLTHIGVWVKIQINILYHRCKFNISNNVLCYEAFSVGL